MLNVDRGPILSIGAACGEPVRWALDELLSIYEAQVKREHAHELAEKIRDAYVGDGPDEDNWVMNPFDAADLIDPEVTS